MKSKMQDQLEASMNEERAICTNCCSNGSEGFFPGCMIRDVPVGTVDFGGWECDGKGHLTRLKKEVE